MVCPHGGHRRHTSPITLPVSDPAVGCSCKVTSTLPATRVSPEFRTRCCGRARVGSTKLGVWSMVITALCREGGRTGQGVTTGIELGTSGMYLERIKLVWLPENLEILPKN